MSGKKKASPQEINRLLDDMRGWLSLVVKTAVIEAIKDAQVAIHEGVRQAVRDELMRHHKGPVH